MLLSLSIHVKSFKFCFWVFSRDGVVSDGTGGLILWSETLFFQDLLVSPMYSAVQLLAMNFQW